MKNRFRRIIAALLAAASIFGLCCSASASHSMQPDSGFADVVGGSWYEKYCNAVAETGVMNGTGAGQFSPMTACNRAMFVTILYRLAGSPVVKAASTMKDVAAGSWYADAVAWAQETGITTGYADGTFGVIDTLNRQSMVTFLHRFAKYMGEDISKSADISTYADSASVQSWAKEAVSWAVGQGVIQGSDKGLEPTAACTRAMAATVISRLYGLVDENVTRKDLEDALVEAAWGYFNKGDKIQYCGRVLDKGLGKWFGGTWRLRLYSTIEDATSDFELYSVCSDFTYSVYDNALNYPMLGARVNSIVEFNWRYSAYPEEMAVLRWTSDTYNDGKPGIREVDTRWNLSKDTKLFTYDEMIVFMQDYEKNLRPGDIFCLHGVSQAGGHNLIYIGNGYILDSGGGSYNMDTGADSRESKGTVDELMTVHDVFLAGDYYCDLGKAAKEDKSFAVLRPLDILCIDDGDGDPSNDKLDTSYVMPKWKLTYDPNVRMSGYTVTNASRSRLKYPSMEIDRTVDITPYGTTANGENLTYNVKIFNKSNGAEYTKWKSAYTGAEYKGETYKALVVKETVPVGTELVSASEGAVINGRNITWTVDIAAGEVKNCSYTVKVTANKGENIENGGGWVDRIPSNVIVNRVGGKKLSADKLTALSQFAAAGAEKWNSNDGYKISAKSAGTKFAMRIYNEAMGLDLKLPDAQEILNNLFELKDLHAEHGYGHKSEASLDTRMFMLRDKVPAGYEAIRNMLIDTYYGGLWVHTDRYNGEDRILNFRFDYLQPGDVILHAKMEQTPDRTKDVKLSEVETMVYLGNDTLALLNTKGEMRLEKNDLSLWKGFAYDFMIALRPSQGYADINTDVKAYDKAKTADLTEADQNVFTDPWSQAGMKKNASGITQESWETQKKPVNQRDFGRWAYLAMGLDISAELTQNISYTIGNYSDTGIFEKVDGKYVVQEKPSERYTGEVKMFVPGAFGGTQVSGGDASKTDEAADFLLGDLICMFKKDDKTRYGMAIKVNDDKFFHASSVTGEAKCGFYTFAELKTQMESDGWFIWYTMRPSGAYPGGN